MLWSIAAEHQLDLLQEPIMGVQLSFLVSPGPSRLGHTHGSGTEGTFAELPVLWDFCLSSMLSKNTQTNAR